jgi:hypothetical protein
MSTRCGGFFERASDAVGRIDLTDRGCLNHASSWIEENPASRIFWRRIHDANFLKIVKFAPALDVLGSFFKDHDFPHFCFEANRDLSSVRLRNFPSPASTLAKRA